MVSANDKSKPKELSREKLQEWNVIRRTLEHFDNKLTNLHTIGLTITFILYGLYFQTENFYMGVFISFLNGVLLLQERFTYDYLTISSQIARNIEEKYAFDHPTLTASLHEQSINVGFLSRRAFSILYVVFIVIGMYIFINGILRSYA